MFQKCLSYYRIFHANKLINRTFSSWQNSPIIFGSQFTQIQQNGNAHCNILFQPQQLRYERYQFCSGNAGNNADADIHRVLDSQFLRLDPYKRRSVMLELRKGITGHKYMEIILIKLGKYSDGPKIPVPKDAYPFVRALDQLILELTAENFEQKLQIPVSNDGYQTNRRIKLQTIELDGLFQKFKLELLFYVNMENGVLVKEISLKLCAVKTNMKEKFLILPLPALPWLRNQMAKMLRKHDGTKAIALEAPAQIPQQFFYMVESTNGRIGTKNSDPIRF